MALLSPPQEAPAPPETRKEASDRGSGVSRGGQAAGIFEGEESGSSVLVDFFGTVVRGDDPADRHGRGSRRSREELSTPSPITGRIPVYHETIGRVVRCPVRTRGRSAAAPGRRSLS
jgi:hypothetical protein